MAVHPMHHALIKALQANRGRHLDMSVLASAPEEGMGVPTHGNDGTDGGYDSDYDEECKELDLAPVGATHLGQDGDEKDEVMGHLGHVGENLMPGAELENHLGGKDAHEEVEQELANSHLGRGSVHSKMVAKKSAKGAEKPVGAGGGRPLSANKV